MVVCLGLSVDAGRSTLDPDPAEVRVVIETRHGLLVEAVRRDRPDGVLMDLRLPGVDGLTAIERINQLPDPPVVVALTNCSVTSDDRRSGDGRPRQPSRS